MASWIWKAIGLVACFLLRTYIFGFFGLCGRMMVNGTQFLASRWWMRAEHCWVIRWAMGLEEFASLYIHDDLTWRGSIRENVRPWKHGPWPNCTREEFGEKIAWVLEQACKEPCRIRTLFSPPRRDRRAAQAFHHHMCALVHVMCLFNEVLIKAACGNLEEGDPEEDLLSQITRTRTKDVRSNAMQALLYLDSRKVLDRLLDERYGVDDGRRIGMCGCPRCQAEGRPGEGKVACDICKLKVYCSVESKARDKTAARVSGLGIPGHRAYCKSTRGVPLPKVHPDLPNLLGAFLERVTLLDA